MKKNIILIVIIFSISLFNSVMAQDVEEPLLLAKGSNPAGAPQFQGQGGPHQPDDPGIFSAVKIFAVADDLKLTDEQLTKLKDLRKKSKREIEELRHQIKLAMWDIQDEFENKTPDKSKIESAVEKISNNQKQIMKIRIDQMFEMKKILTDEQFKKLLSLLETGFFKMKKEMKRIK